MYRQTANLLLLTVKPAKPASVFELLRLDSSTIILHSAVATSKVNRDGDLGCPGIERVFEQTRSYVVERGDGNGGLELVDNILRELPNGHGLLCIVVVVMLGWKAWELGD